MAETEKAKFQRRLQQLKAERQEYETLWSDFAKYVCPDRIRIADGRQKRGSLNRKDIKDNAGTIALRTLKNGMHSGLTSPARPWFRPSPQDPALREDRSAKEYCDLVGMRMRQVINGSNANDVFHTMYGDLGGFGQGVALMQQDDIDYVHLDNCVHGSFWIAVNDKGIVDTLYRRLNMNVEQIVMKFGRDGNLPRSIKDMYSRGQYDEWRVVWHAIEPRWDRDLRSLHRRDKRFASNYWMDEATAEDGDFLRVSGFDHNPILAPRWEPIETTDSYSTSPGQDALPDIMMLQKEATNKHEGIEKKVRPPMVGPASLKNQPSSQLPGRTTYVDDPTGQGFRPAFMVNFDLRELMEDMQEARDRIDRVFYADLFMMLQNMDGVQPRNVLELTQRKEEQLLQLGPVLERVYREWLRPFLRFTYAVMEDARILPPPPPSLEGGLDIEFTGTLAQAQKAVATGPVERLFGFVGNLAGVKPEILDKLDFDQAVDVYADQVGAPADLVIPDDQVQETRAQRQRQVQAAANAEMAPKVAQAANQGAQAAALLAGTDAGGGVDTSNLLASLGVAG